MPKKHSSGYFRSYITSAVNVEKEGPKGSLARLHTSDTPASVNERNRELGA
jgi:hypothetical protein